MPQIFVMYSNRTKVTGRAMVQELGTLMRRSRLSGSVHGAMDYMNGNWDLIIRWGNGGAAYSPNAEIFNSGNALVKSSDKIEMLKAFRLCAVPCPNYWLSSEFRHIHWPVIVRGRYHWSGKEFYEISNHDRLMRYADRNHYACSIIDVKDEYRVFVFNGKVMEINKKSQEGEVSFQRNIRIRNFDNGWIFRRGGFEVPEGIRSAAKQALNAIGLDFGAADVYVDRQGVAGVFEINSAPSLVPRKLRKLCIKILNKYYNVFDEVEVEDLIAEMRDVRDEA